MALASTTRAMTRSTVLLSGLLVLAAIGCLIPVGQAHADAPAWRTLAFAGPTHARLHGHVQTVTVKADGGEFRLSFDGSTTVDLPYNASATRVADELNALPSIGGAGGSVRVTGGPGGHTSRSYVVWFEEGFDGEVLPVLSAVNGTTPLATDVLPIALAAERLPSTSVYVLATNVGGQDSTGPLTATVGPLPDGIATTATPTGAGWSCSAGAGQATVTCTHGAVASQRVTAPLEVPVSIAPAGAPASVPVDVEGGGTASADSVSVPLRVSDTDAGPGIAAFWAGAFDSDGQPEVAAGRHPHSGSAFLMVNTMLNRVGEVTPTADLRNVKVDLPVGFMGNPLAPGRCPIERMGICGDPNAVVGTATPLTQSLNSDSGNGVAVVNDEPPRGFAAQFDFTIVDARAFALGSVRSESDFGVTALAPNVPTRYKVYGNFLSFDGTAPNGNAFLTNPTECSGSVLTTFISSDWWQHPGMFSDPLGSDVPAVTGCGSVPFEPSVSLTPKPATTTDGTALADSASGLEAEISLPQEGLLDPNGIATSHLKKTIVTLPEGFSVNPSGATGLAGCSDAQIGLKSRAEVSCPDGSKLGTVSVTSPLVDQPLTGEMYLGTPKSTDPMSGEMLRLFLVVRNDRYGLLVKLAGSTTADPVTGQLVATFDNNPRVPFDNLEVKLRGGSRGLLATGQGCGDATSSAVLSPWSGTADVSSESVLALEANCAFGFAPKLTAGMSSATARSTGAFSFKFSREDGEQWVDGLTARLPKGLLASVKDLPLCSSGQAAAGVCPESSRIGTVDATAGVGDPFVLERKGTAYLTEGYKGCAYGLAVVVPVVAGPFDGTSPQTDLGDIVVRQAVCVDPTTAEVSAISDPLPTIWHGIPLRVRSVTVILDRPGFMLNPSDCTAKQVGATFHSNHGATADASTLFSTSECVSLPFKPTLAMRLTGRRQVTTGRHPGVRAKVTQQGVSEAGIDKTVVRLPKSLALDPNNAQALCEFEDGIKPDLENHCPKGSIVGRARAKTPLLKNDLVGNVYFVKNIRIDPDTGNEIRTLPMIVVALRGEIAVNLKGESSTTKSGRLVNTFANVPDAPISQFNLNIKGGRNGILAVTRTRRAKINLCAGRHIAEVDNDGQNGRRHDFNVRMKTPCSKRQTRNAKRAAKKAARKARNTRS